MSLLSSFLSAITLLGTPAEVYVNGIGYILVALSFFVTMPLIAYLYLPILHRLNITSAFEVFYRLSLLLKDLKANHVLHTHTVSGAEIFSCRENVCRNSLYDKVSIV